MGRLVKGDVVVVPFPYSDLSTSKRRPALVVTPLTGDDVILCQITSRFVTDEYVVHLDATDFKSGGLRQASNIRPNRLFTADGKMISYRAGAVSTERMKEVVAEIVRIVEGE